MLYEDDKVLEREWWRRYRIQRYNADIFASRCSYADKFYIQRHLHTYFAFKPFCTKTTQTLLPTNPFYIHRRLCTQTHLQYTEICFSTRAAFAYRCFYTQRLLHTETFIHKSNTRTVRHRRLYTQTLLRTDVFSHRGFCTQKLLPTKAIKHRS